MPLLLLRHWSRIEVLKLFARGAVRLGSGQPTGSVSDHHVADLLLLSSGQVGHAWLSSIIAVAHQPLIALLARH